MIPELRLGVAVLTNQESGAAFNAIVYRVLDHYLGAKAPDYPALFSQIVTAEPARSCATAEQQAAAAARLDGRTLAAAGQIRRHLSRPLVRRCEGHPGGKRARHPA